MAAEITADNWRDFAACRKGSGYDPDLWFPVGVAGPAAKQTTEAKDICRKKCPVRAECLAWALEKGQEYGIAGGMTEDERRKLRRNDRRRALVLAGLAEIRPLRPAVGDTEPEQVAS